MAEAEARAATLNGARAAAVLRRHLAAVRAERLRRPRAEPVVARAVERDDRAGERAPERRRSERDSHACSSSRPSRCSGTVRAAAFQTASGYLRSDCVSKWPAATASTAIPSSRHSRASARVSPSTAARAALECVMPGQAVMRRERDVDDRAAALRPERELGRGARHQLGAADVEARDRAPALRLDRLGRHEVLAARVVDQHVEAPAALEREADHALGVVALADVARDGVRAELRRGRLEHLAAPAGDHDLRAAGAQLRRRGAPEAGAAAGDEHDAAVEHPGGEDLRHRAWQRIRR